MNEIRKTIIFAASALVLGLLAFAMTPGRITPDAFLDQGEQFYPDFTDPNEATSLEVITFDEKSGTAKPFNVTFSNGYWSIPSHHNYPADAKDRLAQTAAGVIGITKDDFRTNTVADHEACGVIDPMDETVTTLTGRGSRVTLKGPGDKILADYIIGKKVPEREGYRFVRIPGQNRVYVSKMNIDISTRFADWIDTDLLEVAKNRIEKIVFNDYSINERTYSIEQRGTITLKKQNNEWTMSPNSGNKPLDSARIDEILTTLANLTIVGVRPKPAGISASLDETGKGDKISQSDRMSLQNKGFYFSRDGELLSNEGEVKVYTNEGVIYTLRFGEVLYGSGDEVTAGLSSDDKQQKNNGSQTENRYLFLTAEFNDSYFKKPPEPKSMDFESKPDSLWSDADRENKRMQNNLDTWFSKVDKGRSTATDLNTRFSDWYYVISADSFDKIHVSGKDLISKEQS